MHRIHPTAGLAAAFLLAAVGCGGQSVYPVTGKVTYEGKPLVGGGSIAFVPLGDQPGRAAGGFIAEDGTYTMTTNREGDGSMAGEFRVVIIQQTEHEPEATPDGQAPAKARSVPPAQRIPAVYSDPQHSPLRAKVEAGGKNQIDFDLKRGAVGPNTRPPGARAPGRPRDPLARLGR